MKINAHTGNIRKALEIIVEEIKLAKDKETVEIEASVRWGYKTV